MVSRGGEQVAIALVDPDAGRFLARIRMPSQFRVGDRLSVVVLGLDAELFDYYHLRDGVAQLDPYARLVVPDPDAPLGFRCRVRSEAFNWGGARHATATIPGRLLAESATATVTLRGPVEEDRTVTGYGDLVGQIPTLLRDGVGVVVLRGLFGPHRNPGTPNPSMPPVVPGGAPVGLFAPSPFPAASDRPDVECKEMIRALRLAEIQVIIDVGEAVKAVRELPRNHMRLLLAALRHWVTEYRVDGFRLGPPEAVEAGTGRWGEALMSTIRADPTLRDRQLLP